MEVVPLGPGWEGAYEAFLGRRDGSLLYASLRYRDFLRHLLGCEAEYLLAVEGGEVRGALPLMSRTAAGRRVYNSLPFYGSNGGVIADTPAAGEALRDAYNARAADPATLAATVIENPFDAPTAGFVQTHRDGRIAQWTDVLPGDADVEAFLRRVDSSARRNVRKALASGVVAERDAGQLPRLRELHRENMAALGGRAKPDEFFAAVPAFFRAGQDWDLYVARLGGRVVAGLLLFYYGRTVEYFTPAVEEAAGPLQPLALLIATALADAARRGLTRWNWGGTWDSQVGVYRFKKKWAAREKRYAYYVQVNDPGLLRQAPERLLAEYPYFYVVPFGALRKEAV